MSRARTPLALLVLAAVLAGFALIAVVLLPNPGASAAVKVNHAPAAVQAPAVDPFLGALLGDGELPANADDLSYAADRVCEGVTAGVAPEVMEAGVSAEFGVGEADAREFVRLAAMIRCSAS